MDDTPRPARLPAQGPARLADRARRRRLVPARQPPRPRGLDRARRGPQGHRPDLPPLPRPGLPGARQPALQRVDRGRHLARLERVRYSSNGMALRGLSLLLLLLPPRGE